MTAWHPTGILLINLGTPDHPSTRAVRAYLREFLSDPRVLDLPKIIRSLFLTTVILPRRPRQSAHAYQQIWTEHGSPLLHHSRQLTDALAEKLGHPYVVSLGMRYGKPSIESAVTHLLEQQCQDIVILPLFPQYSSAATGSAIEKTLSLLQQKWNIPSIRVLSQFHTHPLFIQAYADLIQTQWEKERPDFLLMSYHGLPERHLSKSQCHRHRTCQETRGCPAHTIHPYCYRYQCFQTSRALAKALRLKDSQYTVAFQSQLGRTPWIKPYTHTLLPELAERGIKKLAIACPSFVADCLETLEEIDIRANQQWQALSGSPLQRIPCLNAHPTWVDALSQMLTQS